MLEPSFIFCRITYLPALIFARQQGLYVTLHCGEVIDLFFVPFILVFVWQFFFFLTVCSGIKFKGDTQYA